MDLYIQSLRLYCLCQIHHLLFYPEEPGVTSYALRFSLHKWFETSRNAICGLCSIPKSILWAQYVCYVFGSLCGSKCRFGLFMVCFLLWNWHYSHVSKSLKVSDDIYLPPANDSPSSTITICSVQTRALTWHVCCAFEFSLWSPKIYPESIFSALCCRQRTIQMKV